MRCLGWFRCVVPGLFLAFACSSSGQRANGLDAGGSGGRPGTGGGSATGGAAGGSAASGGGSGIAAVACTGGNATNGVEPGAIANPADFSINPETNALDQHTLLMNRGDVIRRVTMYLTGGNADHQHEILFTDAQLVALLAGQMVAVTTNGPPLNAATGHSHTVTVRPCGITGSGTGGSVGAGGAGGSPGVGGNPGS